MEEKKEKNIDTDDKKQKEKKKKLSSGNYEIPIANKNSKGKKIFHTSNSDMLRALKKLGFSISAALREGEVSPEMLEKCNDNLFEQLDRYVDYVKYKKWTDLCDELGKSVAAYNEDNQIAALEVLSHLNADRRGILTIDGKKRPGLWAPDLSACVTRMLGIYKVNKETNNGFFSNLPKTKPN